MKGCVGGVVYIVLFAHKNRSAYSYGLSFAMSGYCRKIVFVREVFVIIPEVNLASVMD